MLLKQKNLEFEEIAVGTDRKARAEMERLSGGRSVPQIFIDQKPIGGFDQLSALERSGELDELMNGTVETVRYIKSVTESGAFDLVVMPICEEIYRIIHEGVSPREAVGKLMRRALKPE